MNAIDIDAIQARFDNIINSFGTSSSSFVSEEFISQNSFILQEIEDTTEEITLTVTTFEDQNDGGSSNGLSLRDALLRARADSSNRYVINLPAGQYDLFIQGNEDLLFPTNDGNAPGEVDNIVTRTGDLDIESNVRIIGAGADQTIISAENLGDRIFDVRDGGLLILENVTIQDGLVNNTIDENGTSGGGIRIAATGSAVINNSIIRNNETAINATDNNNGGGIANFGDTEIINSIISGNLSGDDAGGIFNTGVLDIRNSSIVGNLANAAAVEVIEAGGGGIYNTLGGSLQILNSTIAGNITGDAGGGILSENATTSVINTTISENFAQIGSGITSLGSATPLQLQNSIVAGNEDSADIEGFFTQDSSFNIIGDGNGVLLDDFNNNIVGNITSPVDPRLGPLQNNGGLTPTFEPLGDSPAIDAGDNNISIAVGVNDQRDRSRIVNSIVDIGSVEAQQAIDPALDTPIFRFQNTAVPGTYLFVDDTERQTVLNDFPDFVEEGVAFNVASGPGDDLIAIFRFQNSAIPGTYLYVDEQERQDVLANNPEFTEEGLAFYVFGGDAQRAQDIYRFQNQNLPGTYLFVSEAERLNIQQNFGNFTEEGVAFEAGF